MYWQTSFEGDAYAGVMVKGKEEEKFVPAMLKEGSKNAHCKSAKELEKLPVMVMVEVTPVETSSGDIVENNGASNTRKGKGASKSS